MDRCGTILYVRNDGNMHVPVVNLSSSYRHSRFRLLDPLSRTTCSKPPAFGTACWIRAWPHFRIVAGIRRNTYRAFPDGLPKSPHGAKGHCFNSIPYATLHGVAQTRFRIRRVKAFEHIVSVLLGTVALRDGFAQRLELALTHGSLAQPPSPSHEKANRRGGCTPGWRLCHGRST